MCKSQWVISGGWLAGRGGVRMEKGERDHIIFVLIASSLRMIMYNIIYVNISLL